MASVMSDDIGDVNLTGSMSSVFMSFDTQVGLCAEPVGGCGAALARRHSQGEGAVGSPLNTPASSIIVPGAGCLPRVGDLRSMTPQI